MGPRNAAAPASATTTRLRGAKTNNLKGIDLDLQSGSFLAICGPSGAGKSSLAFGTLYAEGQRRFIESFSAYARQFLERLSRPPVDELDPVPAGIAVDRQAPVRTSRSTVGTMTEITDYAKSLWAKLAELTCPGCGEPVRPDEPGSIAERLLQLARDERLLITFERSFSGVEGWLAARESLAAQGYRRIWIDNRLADLDTVRPSQVMHPDTVPKGNQLAPGRLTVVADRLTAKPDARARLVEAAEAALREGHGRLAAIVMPREGEPRRLAFSTGLHCAGCDRAFSAATPAMFSFNNPVGACETCHGFGRVISLDMDRIIPDKSLTLSEGAIRAWHGKATTWERKALTKHAKAAGIPLDLPLSQFSQAQWDWLEHGDPSNRSNRSHKRWFGIRGWWEWLETRAYKMHVRVFLSRYRKYETCSACNGTRLKPEARWWRIHGMSLPDFFQQPIGQSADWMASLHRENELDPAVGQLAEDCLARLQFLCDVGLEYLTLDRTSRSLSGGETQRVALAGALGASLSGAMFVLDEPTVGLHPQDVQRLTAVVRRLATGDNTVVVVEHDPGVIRQADRVVELGPGAGEQGGHVIFDGSPHELSQADTATARVLRGQQRHGGPDARPPRPSPGWIELTGAHGHNLKGDTLRLPLGNFTCVTGVSGSGKSSLILETLYPAVAKRFARAPESALDYENLSGTEPLTGCLKVDQSPLGRTSRGNAATYCGAWDVFRKRFSSTPLAKSRDYKPGFFSFNVPGGRCETCKGEGSETVEMQFLSDVTFTCPDCKGRRFVGPVLDVKYGGLDVTEVLDFTVDEALARFDDDPDLFLRLEPLVLTGLGYLTLGQPLNTLSGGEAQRLKLAHALGQAAPGSLVVVDEPTAGLHDQDVAPLLAVLHKLAERGDTVVVVEHHMGVAASADHVVDMGPGPGNAGGQIVACGTPHEVGRGGTGFTAPFLAEALGLEPDATQNDTSAVSTVDAAGASVAPPADGITVVRAREHNLKSVSVTIPKHKLVVVTGPSGSGKSSLTFDVIFAEGQRRYLETLSAYARQYMPQLPRPHVDRVTGVPPSVSLEQRITRSGANSTVATLTEVAHYLRLLWARTGVLHCPGCRVPIEMSTPAAVAEELTARLGTTSSGRPRKKSVNLQVLAPVVRGKKGNHRVLLQRLYKEGCRSARIDGAWTPLKPGHSLSRYKEHDVDVVVGETELHNGDLVDLLKRAAFLGDGIVYIRHGDTELVRATSRTCPSCGDGFPELDPRFFSFNTRQGACPACDGRGEIPEPQGPPAGAKVSRPGRKKNKGTQPERFITCTHCNGSRLSPLARSVLVQGMAFDTLLSQSVSQALKSLEALELTGRDALVGSAALDEARRRLAFLERVGLGYLELGRGAHTLSGGEGQRVRLAAQLGSGLTGVLYVLDEPTIGLHPRDTGRLIDAMRALVDKGNTVLVVEHDADTIRAADELVDVGPAGGSGGGRVVAQGSPKALLNKAGSITGMALARAAQVPERRRNTRRVKKIVLKGASQHNLKRAQVSIPVGVLTAVTGVSGSGKSTLVRDVLLPAVRNELGLVVDQPPGPFTSIHGAQHVSRAVEIDQSPIGRTPRSVPATYVGIWDEIRKLLAGTPDARARGYTASRFSFNVAAGRCPECDGQGSRSVEMAFLPNVRVDCESCHGARFNPETLQVRYRNLNAGEILDLDISEALHVFASVPKVLGPLTLLHELGLGYLKLGQASNALSGGEAQRMKLVAELSVGAHANTLYVMDEPTTGLHRNDVLRLVVLLQKLVDRGNTVVVIEHQPDLILAADHVIDLGPEGGAEGGRIIAKGTPEQVIEAHTHTGAALLRELHA